MLVLYRAVYSAAIHISYRTSLVWYQNKNVAKEWQKNHPKPEMLVIPRTVGKRTGIMQEKLVKKVLLHTSCFIHIFWDVDTNTH